MIACCLLVNLDGFNSKRTSQAISPQIDVNKGLDINKFQFQADFPSHFTISIDGVLLINVTVSIQSGLPKPFHPMSTIANARVSQFQFQADFPSHFTVKVK